MFNVLAYAMHVCTSNIYIYHTHIGEARAILHTHTHTHTHTVSQNLIVHT